MPEPLYLKPETEQMISDALLFYARHNGDLTAQAREDALDWHHALTNDTYLLQTAVEPEEARCASHV